MDIPRLPRKNSLDPFTIVEFEIGIYRTNGFRNDLRPTSEAIPPLVFLKERVSERVSDNAKNYLKASACARKPRTEIVSKGGKLRVGERVSVDSPTERPKCLENVAEILE
jgi:hypothetical protein